MGKTLLTGKQQEELYVFVLFIFSLTCRENQLFFFKDTVRFWTICKTLGSMKQQQPLRRKQRLPTRMTRRSLQDCWRRNGLQWSDCRRRFASSLSSFSFSIVVVLCFVLVRPRGITGCLLDLRLKFFLFVVACLFIFFLSRWWIWRSRQRCCKRRWTVLPHGSPPAQLIGFPGEKKETESNTDTQTSIIALEQRRKLKLCIFSAPQTTWEICAQWPPQSHHTRRLSSCVQCFGYCLKNQS